MTDHVRFVRRNRVDERVSIAIAFVAGLVAQFSGAEPTGSTAVDAVLVFLTVAAVTWGSASAPWWASAAACGLAATVSFNPVALVVGAIGFVAGLWIGVRRRDQSEVRAAVGGVAANVLLWSELELVLGLSAIIGCAIGLALFVLGVRRRPRAIRRIGWGLLAGSSAFVVLALIGVAAAGNSARPDVTAGTDAARSAINLLSDGDYDLAADRFDQAAANFASADDRLSGPLALPSRVIPGVAQNVRAAADLSASASTVLADMAASLRQIDPSTLQVTGGAIDIEAVRAVEAPLVQVQDAVAELRRDIDEVDSPWLLDRIDRELDELQADFDNEEPRLQNAIDAVRLAPDLLGADVQRRYLVLFTTPAEARGLGGFPGNYAEITISDGRIEVSNFDRRSDLERVIAQQGASCAECPEEFLARYGQFGFTTGPDGGVAPLAWSNITMPAHFPYVAETAKLLYPQSGGRSIDGVIVMDPYVVEALMTYTGPIEVDQLGVTVRPRDAAQFILEDQYVLAGDDANAERIDALDTLGQEVIVRLLSGTLPEPPELADDLAPLVAERRLLVWSDDPVEQEFLDRIGLLGSLPELDDNGGFSVSVTNAGASKLDVFLDRRVSVEVETPSEGPSTLRATVELTNNAPSSGLPRYVIGNSVGLEQGWSRLYVSFYGPPQLEAVVRDGQEIPVESHLEAGWSVFGTYVDIAPGDTVRYELEFSGIRSFDEPPTVFDQPISDRSS